jgi:hypothetical protein
MTKTNLEGIQEKTLEHCLPLSLNILSYSLNPGLV